MRTYADMCDLPMFFAHYSSSAAPPPPEGIIAMTKGVWPNYIDFTKGHDVSENCTTFCPHLANVVQWRLDGQI